MFGIAAQPRQRRRDLLLRARHLRLGDIESVARLVELRLADGMRREQPGLAVIFALRVVQRVLRRLQLRLALAIGGAHGFNLEARRPQRRLGAVAIGEIDRIVDPEQNLPRLDVLIVVDIDLDDMARDAGRDVQHVGLAVGVVGRNVAARGQIPPAAADHDRERHHEHQDQPRPAPAAARRFFRDGAGTRPAWRRIVAGRGCGAQGFRGRAHDPVSASSAMRAPRSPRLPRMRTNKSNKPSRSRGVRPANASSSSASAIAWNSTIFGRVRAVI